MTLSEKIMDIFKWVFVKLTSARFLTIVALIWTLCIVLLRCLDLMSNNTGNKELFVIYKDLFLVIFGAFIGFVGTAITFYFTRNDRVKRTTDEDVEEDKTTKEIK